jgi:hypothetical protein
MQQPIVETITDNTGVTWSTPNIAKATDPLFPKPLQLWDCIDQSWTKPMVRIRAMDTYLPKRVVKCSACDYTTVFRADTLGGNIRPHVNQIYEHAVQHDNAEAMTPTMTEKGIAIQICTGCGMSFQVGKAMPHIMEQRTMSASHQRVEALLMNRFALEPSQPTIFSREAVVDGPEVRQVETETPPSNGSRRRRRTRGRGRTIH